MIEKQNEIPQIFALAHKLEQKLEIIKGEQSDLRESLESALDQIKEWKQCAAELVHVIKYLKPDLMEEPWGFTTEKKALLEYERLLNL